MNATVARCNTRGTAVLLRSGRPRCENLLASRTARPRPVESVGPASLPFSSRVSKTNLFGWAALSTRAACVIPPHWTLTDYAAHRCGDRSHFHLSRIEFEQNLRDGAIELLRGPDRRRGLKAVVRIRRIVWRGLSLRVGEELALALREAAARECYDGWAHVMLANIRMRRELPSNPVPEGIGGQIP